jgi:hypothetical protein
MFRARADPRLHAVEAALFARPRMNTTASGTARCSLTRRVIDPLCQHHTRPVQSHRSKSLSGTSGGSS